MVGQGRAHEYHRCAMTVRDMTLPSGDWNPRVVGHLFGPHNFLPKQPRATICSKLV
jgi:hypothetical protein